MNDVSIAVIVQLPSPVEIPVERRGHERIYSVEWHASAAGDSVKIRCYARGNYHVWAVYPEGEVPEWVPACPPSLRSSARTLLNEVSGS